jgi:hypothetical protein
MYHTDEGRWRFYVVSPYASVGFAKHFPCHGFLCSVAKRKGLCQTVLGKTVFCFSSTFKLHVVPTGLSLPAGRRTRPVYEGAATLSKVVAPVGTAPVEQVA